MIARTTTSAIYLSQRGHDQEWERKHPTLWTGRDIRNVPAGSSFAAWPRRANSRAPPLSSVGSGTPRSSPRGISSTRTSCSLLFVLSSSGARSSGCGPPPPPLRSPPPCCRWTSACLAVRRAVAAAARRRPRSARCRCRSVLLGCVDGARPSIISGARPEGPRRSQHPVRAHPFPSWLLRLRPRGRSRPLDANLASRRRPCRNLGLGRAGRGHSGRRAWLGFSPAPLDSAQG